MAPSVANPKAARLNATTGLAAIVVGAGPAGLACAAALKAVGMDALVLEQAECVGVTWQRHYDRLHLHTDRNHSGLPGFAMPKIYPRYPSREQVLAYFEDYAAHFRIKPIFGSRVDTIEREDAGWRVAAGAATFHTRTVVIATGMAGGPQLPLWAATGVMQDRIIHSSAYRNPTFYAGKRVLVVGLGNSGGEIALDLAEAGVEVALSVRGPVQVIPRDLLGLPILTWVIAFNRLPARLADAITSPILRLACGSIERIGLVRASKGPRQMVEEDGRVPLIDIGTLAAIRSGAIKVRGAIERPRAHGVTFVDGTDESFDTIILATGFGCDLRPMLPGAGHLLDDHGTPRRTGVATSEAGLYFCGQVAAVTGQLRAIALEAERIALLASRV